MGNVMYRKGCGINDEPILWAAAQLDQIQTYRLKAMAFMQYMQKDLEGENPNMVCGSEENTPYWPKYKCSYQILSFQLEEYPQLN